MEYNSIYKGIVEVNEDPLGLGRCKIRIPSVHGRLSSSQINLLPWASYISPLPTGSNKGMYIVPEVKDMVWVMFDGGDKNYPVYIGSSFGVVGGMKETPADDIITEVLYSSRGGEASIKKNDEEFIFKYKDSYIKILSDGSIEINSSKDIDIKGKNVSIKCDNINLVSNNLIDISGDVVNVEGNIVNLNGNVSINNQTIESIITKVHNSLID